MIPTSLRTEEDLAIGAVGVELILLGPDVPGDLNPVDCGVLLGRPFKGAVIHICVQRITNIAYYEG